MIDLKNIEVTVVTPTTGKPSLHNLLESLERQTIPCVHILLWDSKRDDSSDDSRDSFMGPSKNGCRYNIEIPGSFVQGTAYGSALRAVGLMAANTPFITFADDDVWYEDDHLETLLKSIKENNHKWGFSVRKIWTNKGECLGEDRFESVGDSPTRKVPYEMVDNNVMMFSRKFGASGACLYRETSDYNDDRLMYGFLKQYAGKPCVSNRATVNQVCPERLEHFFRQLCDK